MTPVGVCRQLRAAANRRAVDGRRAARPGIMKNSPTAGKMADQTSGASEKPAARFQSGLDAIFSPHTVAVIGATETPGTVGRAVVENLASLGNRIFPVNPKRATVLGRKAFPNIGAVPEPVDLAVMTGFDPDEIARFPVS